MEPQPRRITYRIYPTVAQAVKLGEMARLHCELYNAALEERREAYRKQRLSVGYVAQTNQLPEIKEIRPELKDLGAHALQATLKRLDLAFAAFFRRVKSDETPGYPRFKSAARFKGWTYPDRDNWRIEQAEGGAHGHLILKGVGTLKLRGRARTWGDPRTLTVTRKDDRWYASVVVDCLPVRGHGNEAVGLDWGVESFATLSTGERIENPRVLAQAEEQLVKAQRDLSRKRGPWGRRKPSENWRKARALVSALHRKVANQRTEFLHQQSAALVNRFSWIATEKLQIAGMTASARGTIEEPGKNVQQKAGLNRAILDTAPSAFLSMLAYKAEEAGGVVAWVDTRKWKPSQTCPECWRVRKKALAERVHSCECGCVMHRDHASALVQLKVSLGLAGREPAPCGGDSASPSKHETASHATGVGGA